MGRGGDLLLSLPVLTIGQIALEFARSLARAVPTMRPVAVNASDPKAQQMTLSGVNIILVEDDFDSREVIAQTLQTFARSSMPCSWSTLSWKSSADRIFGKMKSWL